MLSCSEEEDDDGVVSAGTVGVGVEVGVLVVGGGC
jgi:hypothetical protein